jgi:hypothetical protein
MKVLKLVLIALTLVSSISVVQAAPQFLGTAMMFQNDDRSIFKENDLTIIQDGPVRYEFLDISMTFGIGQAAALSQYGQYGFQVGTSADLSRLFETFGLHYNNDFRYDTEGNPGGNAAVFETTTFGPGAGAINYLLGRNGLGVTRASYIDLTYGQSAFCIAFMECGGFAYAINYDLSGPSPMEFNQYGVLMVRAVPEPSQTALILVGLLGMGIGAVRRKATKAS